jgi:hypothetical protein
MKNGLLVILIAFASIGTAFAHTRTIADEDEGNFIDVESGSQGHPRERGYRAHLVSFKIQTYPPFTNAELQEPEGDNEAIAIGISTEAGRAFERVILVKVREDSSGFAPYAIVTGGRRQPDADLNAFTPRRNLIGYAQVSRPTNDSIRIVFPERMLKKGGVDGFRWQARFVSSKPGSGAVGFDYVPNSRLARGHTSG